MFSLATHLDAFWIRLLKLDILVSVWALSGRLNFQGIPPPRLWSHPPGNILTPWFVKEQKGESWFVY
jgi:hypothetical protein